MAKFKTIPHKPDYEITKDGIVRNKHTKEIIPETLTPDGYSVVYLRGDRTKYPKERVHILVYATFKDQDIKGKEIDHIDGNKQNNKLNNLEIVSHRENMKRAVKNKLITNNRQFTIKNIKTGEIISASSVVELENIMGKDSTSIINKLKNSNANPINGTFVAINPPDSLDTLVNNGGRKPKPIEITNLETKEIKKYCSIYSASYDTGLSIGFFHRRLNKKITGKRSDTLPLKINYINKI